jgi:diguanylate cyclase (GGDEF)-like protein
MASHRLFMQALIYMIVFIVSDNLAFLITSGTLPWNSAAVIILKSFYFVSTTVMCFYWFLHFEALRMTVYATDNKKRLTAFIPAFIQIILTFINLRAGFFFKTCDGAYVRGSLFALQYIFAYFYIAVAIVRAIRGALLEKNFIDKSRIVTYAAFPVPPAVAGIIQFFRPELPVACTALTVSMLIMYLDFLENSISLDPLTKLSNRKELLFHLTRRMRSMQDKNSDLYVMMIDANFFKQINDNYGHVEGDLALIRISKAMKRCFNDSRKRPILARYGGDEFTVVMEADSFTEVKNVADSLKETLRVLNEEAKAPYDLTLSIGIAKYDASVKSVRDLIDLADEELYKEKGIAHQGS